MLIVEMLSKPIITSVKHIFNSILKRKQMIHANNSSECITDISSVRVVVNQFYFAIAKKSPESIFFGGIRTNFLKFQ